MIRNMIAARVFVNDLLFVVGAISLAYCLIKISKCSSANILLKAKVRTDPACSFNIV